MKKILYIFAAILLATACNEELVKDNVKEAEEGKMVKINFTVQTPESDATRASWGEEPEIESLWVIEFGASGYFKRWVQAEIAAPVTTNGEGGKKAYTVELPVSSSTQYFHFIANPPATASFVNKTMAEVMSQMQTTGGNAAYWQLIAVKDGIRGIEQSDGTVKPTVESQAYFTSIPLIRNFAKVRVYSKDSRLNILRYALVNVPTGGKVAPFDADTYDFEKLFIRDSTLSNLSFSNLYNNGNGYKPLPATIQTTTDASSLTFTTSGNLFMYERPLPVEDPTCVLVQIQNNTTLGIGGWYKIEILDEGKYVPIYRDFLYTINVAALDGMGEASAQAALEGPAFGDVSANLESASLTSISDGTSTLTVSATDIVKQGTIGQTGLTAQLHYAFTTTQANPNPTVVVEIYDAGSGAVTAVTSATGTSGDVTLTLASPAATLKKSVVRVTAKASSTARELYRDVTVRVVGPMDISSATATRTGLSKGNAVTINVVLPPDLGRSLFPMNLLIEAEDNSLSAVTPDISVKTGSDVVSKFNGKNTFFFVKTIAYSDYFEDGYKTLPPLEFVLNKDVTTAPNIKIWDEPHTTEATSGYLNVKDVTWE